jgi:WD40 repeat protein
MIISGSIIDIKIWNIETGTCNRKIEGHSRWVHCIVKLSNEKIFSKTIKVWNVF